MTMLKPSIDKVFQESDAASIASLAEILFEELALMGYSLDTVEIENAIIADYRYYAGWEETPKQHQGQAITINRDYILTVSEWALLDPVVRAHCDLIQSNRVEGTGSLGGERFGLTVSEARNLYAEAKVNLKRESFVEPPFTISF